MYDLGHFGSTVFHSYQGDGSLIMKVCVQGNPVYNWKDCRLWRASNLGPLLLTFWAILYNSCGEMHYLSRFGSWYWNFIKSIYKKKLAIMHVRFEILSICFFSKMCVLVFFSKMCMVIKETSRAYTYKTFKVVFVVVLLLYVHSKQLWSSWDHQLT